MFFFFPGAVSEILKFVKLEIYSQEYCNDIHNVTGGRFGPTVKRAMPDLFEQSNVFCSGAVVSQIIFSLF